MCSFWGSDTKVQPTSTTLTCLLCGSMADGSLPADLPPPCLQTGYTTQVVYTVGTSGWLAVSHSSGTITINQPTNLHLTINPSAAGSGYHTAYVVLMQVCTLAFRLHPEGGHGKGTQAFALLLELNLLHLLHRARCTGLSRVWGRLGALQHCTTSAVLCGLP